MSESPSQPFSLFDWIREDAFMEDSEEGYTSAQPALPSYPTEYPALTESSFSFRREPMPYDQDFDPSDVSDPPGLITAPASSIGSNSPPSPRSLRSESVERELPHSPMDFTPAPDYGQGWVAPGDQYYNTGVDLPAFPIDYTSYPNMAFGSSYLTSMDGVASTQQTASSPPSTESGSSDSGISGFSGSSTESRTSYTGSSDSPVESDSLGLSPSAGSTHKRSRRLDDPDKVAKVRSVGGCVRCKIGKYSCQAAGGPCTQCLRTTNGYAATCCLRQTPSQVIGSENLWGSSPSVRTPRSAQDIERIVVYFPCVNGAIQSRPLQLTVQRTESNDDFCLYQDYVPADDVLEKWVENQMILETQCYGQPSFQLLIERLVMEYANSRSTYSSKRISLVKKVHTLNCMFRIWKSQELFVPESSSPQGVSTLRGIVLVQLQMVAKASITRVQYEIMKEFDKTLKEGNSKDRDLPLWVCLWQAIFIYMELSSMQPNRVRFGLAHEGVVGRTERLYVTLMVMLSMLFKNHSPVIALKTSESEVKRSCGGDSRVFEAFKNVVRGRDAFHQEVLQGAREGSFYSCLWKQLIVETEKDLDRRRKKTKGSSK